MDEIKRALLGDKAAQQAVTDRGELLPCGCCGVDMGKVGDMFFVHPENECYLDGFSFSTRNNVII